nr:hypothetical protein [Bifidobacterium primatium]
MGPTSGFGDADAKHGAAVMGLGQAVLPVMLFVFGAAGVLGSWVAGRVLSADPRRTQMIYGVLLLAALLAVLLVPGRSPLQAVAVIVWGILFGVGNSLQQYIVTTSMPHAPEFANGMSIAFGNVGHRGHHGRRHGHHHALHPCGRMRGMPVRPDPARTADGACPTRRPRTSQSTRRMRSSSSRPSTTTTSRPGSSRPSTA